MTRGIVAGSPSSGCSPWREHGRWSSRHGGSARSGGRPGPGRRGPALARCSPRPARRMGCAMVRSRRGPWGRLPPCGLPARARPGASALAPKRARAPSRRSAVRLAHAPAVRSTAVERHLRSRRGQPTSSADRRHWLGYDLRSTPPRPARSRPSAPRDGTRQGAPRASLIRRFAACPYWRDAVAATRDTGRVVEGAVLAGAGTGCSACSTADRPVALAVAMLVVYFGASRRHRLAAARGARHAGPHARAAAPGGSGSRAGRARGRSGTGDHRRGRAGRERAARWPELGGAVRARGPGRRGARGSRAARGWLRAQGDGSHPASWSTSVAADPSGGLGTLLAWFTFWPSVAAIVGAVPVALVVTSGGAVAACRAESLLATCRPCAAAPLATCLIPADETRAKAHPAAGPRSSQRAMCARPPPMKIPR